MVEAKALHAQTFGNRRHAPAAIIGHEWGGFQLPPMLVRGDRDAEAGFGLGAHAIDGFIRRQFHQRNSALTGLVDVEYAQIRDHPIDHAHTRQRQRALAQQFRRAILGVVFHHNHHALNAGDQIHRPAHAFDHFTRHHPIGEITGFRDFHRPQDRQIDVPAADHRETIGRAEITGFGQFGDGLLARIDQVGIDFMGQWKRPHPQHAVFALQRHFHTGRDIVGHQRRDADAEVHIKPVLQFLGGAFGQLVTCPGHDYAASC